LSANQRLACKSCNFSPCGGGIAVFRGSCLKTEVFKQLYGKGIFGSFFKSGRLEKPQGACDSEFAVMEPFLTKEALLLKGRQITRLALVFCVAYFLCSPVIFFGSLLLSGKENAESKAGMGGGGYPENAVSETALPSPEGESPIAGILEPEVFSRPRMLRYESYTVQEGDIIGDIAQNFGLNQDTLISCNGIRNTRLIQIGQVLRIPNQDGILYTVKKGDTLAVVGEKFQTGAAAIQAVNELFSETIHSGTVLFIPGARLDWVNLQEINGDLFLWPVPGYITSSYGYRASPFTGVRQFHSGLDIGSRMGTPVRAAMAGRVSAAGWDDSFGNYVVISHHSGYRTLYAHMSVVRVKSGAYVGTGERIGDVGSTGLSTAPHLHFTVYKNGVTVNPRSLMK
jgi:murein DD-endopeptidase MepM/ murein hydrolase activator NlpD